MQHNGRIEGLPLLPLQAELIDRLKWFTSIRWMAVAGVLVTVLAAKWILGFENLPAVPLILLVCVIGLLNVIYVIVLRRYFPKDRPDVEQALQQAMIFSQVQILLDLILLTALLHFSGGASNPFNFFYIFHVIISSILLPRSTANAYAFITVALFSGLILLEHTGVIPIYPLMQAIEMDRRYLVGVIFAFGATVFFAAYVTTSIRLQLRQREEEAEVARKALAELEEQKSSFMRMVSHELRSPIAAIQSSLAVLLNLEEKCMDDGMRRSVERASDRAQGLFQLTRDLLEFSRLSALDKKGRNTMDVDMRKMVKHTTELYRPHAADKHLDFFVEVPDNEVILNADPQSLDQMVDNLVSNAIRYTKSGGKVAVRLEIIGNKIVFSVSDTGIGIPAEDLDRVGEEFYRSRNAKQFAPTGTGIGLRIVKETVRLHGGELKIESKEGEGSVFSVVIPLTQRREGQE